MPASASLPIAAIADQLSGVALPDPVTLAPQLQTALAGMANPRERRGIRHGLTVVLTAAICAVAAGARSFVAIAEWAADLPCDLAVILGVDRRCPSEAAIRRLTGRVDADRFDAPALAAADVSLAMSSGTDVAIESAAVTLIKGDLTGIVRARHLSRATMSNIRQNLLFAFVYNAAGIPIAAGVLYPAFGLLLSPMIAAAAMALSSVSVIANALRLPPSTSDSAGPGPSAHWSSDSQQDTSPVSVRCPR